MKNNLDARRVAFGLGMGVGCLIMSGGLLLGAQSLDWGIAGLVVSVSIIALCVFLYE